MRKTVFELLESLRGNPVLSQLADIESTMCLKNYDMLKQKQLPVIAQLLDYVTNKSTYYHKYSGSYSLEDLPVVNKTIIKDNFADINVDLPDKERVLVSTSGSTGTPFKIYQSREKKYRNSADTIFFARSAGFEIGHRLLYLRFWSAYYKKPNWLAFLQNIDQIEVEELTDEYLEALLRNLSKDKQPKGWLGYPSGFDKIIRFLENRKIPPLNCNIRSIIAMAEPLPAYTREKMMHYFKCPVVSRYSNIENGILAQQMPGNDGFTINSASYVVEVLNLNEDKPVDPGELGRIVITDLYNYATPMIRYDTGDIGVLRKPESGLPFFSRIEGRISDLLTNTAGQPISPFLFYNSLGEYPELIQVQVVQKGNDYTFRINAGKSKFKREKEFLDYFVPFLGNGAVVRIDYVQEIPKLHSGKRKVIVNLTEK